jgi:predicted secreted protein
VAVVVAATTPQRAVATAALAAVQVLVGFFSVQAAPAQLDRATTAALLCRIRAGLAAVAGLAQSAVQGVLAATEVTASHRQLLAQRYTAPEAAADRMFIPLPEGLVDSVEEGTALLATTRSKPRTARLIRAVAVAAGQTAVVAQEVPALWLFEQAALRRPRRVRPPSRP